MTLMVSNHPQARLEKEEENSIIKVIKSRRLIHGNIPY
jgi:hypothetical protein